MLDGVNFYGSLCQSRGAFYRLHFVDIGIDERLIRQVNATKFETMPSGAGLIVRETFCPVCREVPSNVAEDASVCSSSVAMRASLLGEKPCSAKLVF